MAYRIFVWLHRWVGLAMTAFLIIVGLTGSLLAFRRPIDSLLNPRLYVHPAPNAKPLDLAVLAARVETIDPRVRAGYFAIEPGQTLIAVQYRVNPATGHYYSEAEIGFDHLVLDPYTGAELGRIRNGKILNGGINLMQLMYDLHTSLMLGGFGGWVLGVMALFWTLDSFVGFYLTLPRGRGGFWQRWKHAWLVKWRASAFRVNFDLHRAAGLWFWLLVFVFAWSSVMLSLRPVYERATGLLFDYETDSAMMSAMLAQPRENPRLNWMDAELAGQRFIAEQAAAHHFTVTRPWGMGYIAQFGVYTYDVRASNDIRGHGWDTGVWIDGDTGALRKVFLPSGQHTGNTISTILWGLHYGDIRDVLLYRWLVCIFGVVLAALSVTGVYIWWRKMRTRQQTARRVREQAPAI